ncbi:MAG TPA: ATP-binding protein [Thermoanaerobaculia bacterium]|nr:ATP-binding protein [Thermoanaerobaculia bacterium]
MLDLAKVPPDLLPVALESNLRRLGPSYKLAGHLVEAVRLRLAADAAWMLPDLDVPATGERRAIVRGDEALYDAALVDAFLARRRPAIPATTVLARVIRHGRQVALVGAVRGERPFGPADRRAVDRLCAVLALELERRERKRLYRVLDRIKEKVVAELRPRDLAYQILDGLHQLVDYDHSSAFLTWDAEAGVLRVEAEKIVWTKAKSAAVGREIPVPPEAIETLQRGLRHGDRAPAAEGEPEWARRIFDDPQTPGMPRIRSLLSAPLFFGDEFLGLLKIAVWKRRPFDDWDAQVVERFLPVAAVAIRNAQWNLSLENQAAQAEVKASLVTLARVVAHDVNNAVGAILPLAQQMQDELRTGGHDAGVLDEDLAVIIDRAQFCKRIFANMLRAGGTGRPGDGPVDLNRAVRETVSFLEAAALRLGIELELALDPSASVVRFSRQDLEHVVLNLVTNSLEAMAERGHKIVVLTGAASPELAYLRVQDDGPGIPENLREKVLEPFFTTKTGGHGLGLALCRSLAWQNGGSFDIESALGEGTAVTVGMRLFNATGGEAAHAG